MDLPLPTAYALRTALGDESRRWKNVTLKLMAGDEEITVPMMQASTVYDVKAMLADALSEDYAKIVFFEKSGCKFKRLRNPDEIPTKVLIKGIKHFGRKTDEYPHPFMVVGAGHLGIRQALHWTRKGQDFLLFERKTKVGGNAWNGIANKWSKLQSEGPHYHMNWDAFDGGKEVMMPYSKYSFWPTRDEILSHFHDIISCFNMWPYMRMATQVMEMEIIPALQGAHDNYKTYRFKYQEVGDKFQKNQDATNDALDDTAKYGNIGYHDFSCTCMYPGALAGPHRKTFPGEDIFGGQIGYGFNDEFDYSLVHQQRGIIIGMGAFAAENIRTLMEHAADKFYVIARHHNLLLPRCLSWWVNQSQMPPPAANVIKAMEPYYKLYGKDPWSFFSITATADRTHASIKQYTRWGIGDIFFLAMYYKKADVIEGEVKRLKYRTAIINNGVVLDNLDHVVKVLGFDGDFGIDRIMKCKVHLGFWPDGDTRRWVCSDQSAIDASRFGGTAIAPYAATCTFWPTHFFNYQPDAKRIIDMQTFTEHKAKPELGSPAYHYDPRSAATVQVTYASIIPEIIEFNTHNDAFKKESMWTPAPPERFLEECEKDWMRYCEKFIEFGSDIQPPPYPYDIHGIYDLLRQESEDQFKMCVRQGMLSQQHADMHLAHTLEVYRQRAEASKWRKDNGLPQEPAHAETLQLEEFHAPHSAEQQQQYELEQGKEGGEAEKTLMPQDAVKKDTIQDRSLMKAAPTGYLEPRTAESFAPARHVFKLRAGVPDFGRAPSPVMRRLNEEWLSGANTVRDAVLQHAKDNYVPPTKKKGVVRDAY